MMPFFCGDDKNRNHQAKAYLLLISLDFYEKKRKKYNIAPTFCYKFLCVWMKNNKILRSINLFLS